MSTQEKLKQLYPKKWYYYREKATNKTKWYLHCLFDEKRYELIATCNIKLKHHENNRDNP